MSKLKAVGAYLQQLREEKGMSRTQAAAALRTSESQVYVVETGKSNPRATFIFDYGALLGANGEYLMELYSGKGVQCGCEAGV